MIQSYQDLIATVTYDEANKLQNIHDLITELEGMS